LFLKQAIDELLCLLQLYLQPISFQDDLRLRTLVPLVLLAFLIPAAQKYCQRKAKNYEC
jgi:hypothetical protein